MSTGRMIGNCGKTIGGTIVEIVIVRPITMGISKSMLAFGMASPTSAKATARMAGRRWGGLWR